MLFKAELLIDKLADNKTVQHSHRTAFCRCEEAKAHPENDAEREELDPLPYSKVVQLGEDMKAYYLFRDQFGGYMIPKSELGNREEDFRKALQERTGKKFIRRLTPIRRLRMWMENRNSEPKHL